MTAWLKNGNAPFDLRRAPRCTAKSKRTGLPCCGPAMANGKCRMHGGKSTGPRNPAIKHGRFTKLAKSGRKVKRVQRRLLRFAASLLPYGESLPEDLRVLWEQALHDYRQAQAELAELEGRDPNA